MDPYYSTSNEFNIGNDNQNVFIQSFGAAGTVTGSKHLLRTPGFNILIDCGLFQGVKSLREKNRDKLPVDPADIGAVILTHAHLDHCGYIPSLIRQGYKGKIYMSYPTRELTELILRDSAKIQEEDAEKANRNRYTIHHPAKPLYTSEDVERSLPFFKAIETGKTYRLSDHIDFRFFPAGHIPGACSVAITCYGKSVVFSGDIGRKNSALLPAPERIKSADYIVMESTYGDRLHSDEDVLRNLANAINETIARNGNILIPCFAVGRAQELIHAIFKLKGDRYIPSSIPAFLDSPMAASAGRILRNYPDWIRISEMECSQMFSRVKINEDHYGTQKIINRKGSKIILAASGMLTGGRVLEYLKHYITDKSNTILMIGYQAEGTRGRALLNGAHEIKIHGRYYPAKARIKEIRGLSAHADQTELLEWLNGFDNKVHVYLVHGEPCALETLRIKIKDELQCKVTIMEQDKKKFLFSVNESDPVQPVIAQ